MNKSYGLKASSLVPGNPNSELEEFKDDVHGCTSAVSVQLSVKQHINTVEL